MLNDEREVSLWKPHSERGAFRFSQLSILRYFRFGAKPPSGKNTRPGQKAILRYSKDLRFCIRLGRNLRFSQKANEKGFEVWHRQASLWK